MVDQPGAGGEANVGTLVMDPSANATKEQEYKTNFSQALNNILGAYETNVVSHLPPVKYEDAVKIDTEYRPSYSPTIEEAEENPESAKIINAAGAGYQKWYQEQS